MYFEIRISLNIVTLLWLQILFSSKVALNEVERFCSALNLINFYCHHFWCSESPVQHYSGNTFMKNLMSTWHQLQLFNCQRNKRKQRQNPKQVDTKKGVKLYIVNVAAQNVYPYLYEGIFRVPFSIQFFFLMVKKYFKCWVISLMAGILLNWDCIHKGLFWICWLKFETF